MLNTLVEGNVGVRISSQDAFFWGGGGGRECFPSRERDKRE